LQAQLPILLHPKPEAVYLLGLGTGITAGGALSLPIKRLVVTELVQEVVSAAEKYFSEYNNHLFFDPRVKIVAEDGRNYLRGADERFDVIISDLFVPWKAGSGNLYSLQHYQSVIRRLRDDGLFMQWLPTYQLSEDEFKIIIRTMLEVFPQLTVWRGDFSALKPVIGLLGQKKQNDLAYQRKVLIQKTLINEMPLLTYYVGNLHQIRAQFSAIELNTDDNPVIEFRSPITQQLTKSGSISWLAGEKLINFMFQFGHAEDVYLAGIDLTMRQLAEAGRHLQASQLYKYQGELIKARHHTELYHQKMPRKN
jgi:spermidine synthase